MEEKKDIRIILEKDSIELVAKTGIIKFPDGLKLDLTFPIDASVMYTMKIIGSFLQNGLAAEKSQREIKRKKIPLIKRIKDYFNGD